jgi:hypothetical protein
VKRLHRSDLFCWSHLDEARNIDFHGYAWVRAGGNVLIDPMPMTPHDEAHLDALGGAAIVVLTNSDHVRGVAQIVARWGARVLVPAAERAAFPFATDGGVSDGDEVAPGLVAMALDGSKTPGELALVLDGATLFCGDLVRAHEAGRLTMLPDAKLADRAAAIGSIRRLASLPAVDAVLVGDGWPVFRDGGRALRELRSAVS